MNYDNATNPRCNEVNKDMRPVPDEIQRFQTAETQIHYNPRKSLPPSHYIEKEVNPRTGQVKEGKTLLGEQIIDKYGGLAWNQQRLKLLLRRAVKQEAENVREFEEARNKPKAMFFLILS